MPFLFRRAGFIRDPYVTLPGKTAWHSLVAEAEPCLARVRALLAAYTPSTNEAQTEHELVRPVLEALGHTFEVQAPLRTPRGVKRPDYVFYRTAAVRSANKGKTLTEADLHSAFAVGDAKYWERRLDVSMVGQNDEVNRIPAEQIAYYMLHSGVDWGILTNGRLSYIVTNKWLRAGYGEGLRGYFAERALVERIVDFDHAPIFADADVFPCIIVLRKPVEGEPVAEQAVPLRVQRAEAQQVERQLADLVNAAYGLTPEEIDLAWRTAPPRLPVGPPNAG